MRCPTVAELPSPPLARNGWPWTIASTPATTNMPDGRAWPKITVITPSYNQGHFLEETIRSVLLQGYPNLEYIIIDGGSSDNSRAIIEKYSRWLKYWQSQNDHGQPNAINIGLDKSSDELVTWLNSDDWYTDNTLVLFALGCEGAWAAGGCVLREKDGRFVKNYPPMAPQSVNDWIRLFANCATLDFPQPSVIWRSRAKTGERLRLREDLHYVFDHEFFIRLLSASGPPRVIDAVLSNYRLHESSKTVRQQIQFGKERLIVAREFAARSGLFFRLRLLVTISLSENMVRLREAIEAGRCNPERVASLLSFGLNRPLIFASRFYLGALRRSLTGMGR
jgi:glycosyltransferase involved in cell wall biosynthesis